MRKLISEIIDHIKHIASSDEFVWLQDEINASLTQDDTPTATAITSAKIRRKLPQTTLPEATLETAAGPIQLKFWTLAEAARIWLYAELIEKKSVPVTTLYAWGDDKERAAVLKALAIFDPKGELLDFAIDVGRTNSVSLYSAIALNNPYPAKFYSDHQFTQLVVKSLFIKLNIEYVQLLAERGCAELANVSAYYVQEILDAKRDIPPSIWLAVCPNATEEGIKFMCQYIHDDNVEHRLYVAYALTKEQAVPAALKPEIVRQLESESDPRVKAFLTELAA